MRGVMIIAALFLLASCSPRLVQTSRDTVTTVRTEYIEVLKDSVVFVELPQDSVATVTRDTSSVLRIRAAVSEASVSGGILSHRLYTNPEYRPEVKIQYRDIVRYRDTTIVSSGIDTVEVPRKLSGWQKAMQAGGYILMGLIAAAAVWLAIRIAKR